jgi:hypothetical protein
VQDAVDGESMRMIDLVLLAAMVFLLLSPIIEIVQAMPIKYGTSANARSVYARVPDFRHRPLVREQCLHGDLCLIRCTKWDCINVCPPGIPCW